MSETSIHMVLSTAPDVDVAREIACTVVKARLAACVHLVEGMYSVYSWQDSLQQDEEVLMFMKTTACRLPQLIDAIVECHPYECPEVVAVPIMDGHQPYLDWVSETVAS